MTMATESVHAFGAPNPGALCGYLVTTFHRSLGLAVLDAGCGEGKNAAFLAAAGAVVDALDISTLAIENGLKYWAEYMGIRWRVADIRESDFPKDHYSVVVSYGLLHCMSSAKEINDIIVRLQNATRVGGYNVICVFNDRRQELHAHPGFSPSLLPHSAYQAAYSSWEVLNSTLSDRLPFPPPLVAIQGLDFEYF
jgi:SAM-dependent methyltransferase